MDVETKYALLKENIKNYGKIAVAYCGIHTNRFTTSSRIFRK